jgi:hypothetical protein
VLAPRELPLPAGFQHPEYLRLESPFGDATMVRVDHPVFDVLYHGDPTKGWEGDRRLCMYLDAAVDKWVLLRLEGDMTYRITCASPMGMLATPEAANRLVDYLVAYDQRRGWDPHEGMVARREAQEKAEAAAFHDRVDNDLAPKLAFALRKDGADNYC